MKGWIRRVSGAFLACAISAGGASAQVSDDVVKLGILTDMSSIYADGTGQGSVAAAQLAVEDAGGKVLGKPIEIVSADHQNKPDVGANIARSWYDTAKVDAVVDVPTSSIALAVQTITKERNRVFLISGGGSSDLTGSACSPNGIQWTYDTYGQANVLGPALVKRGDDTWFFITADYAFGHALERDATAAVKKAGGKVLGSVRAPFGTQDFSSFLLQAQASGAKVVALASAGGDTQTAIKQGAEFGLTPKQKFASLLMTLTDAHSLGQKAIQGLNVAEGWYWDQDDESRAFAERFEAKMNRKPAAIQAGVYSTIRHYLKAIEAAGTDAAPAVIAKMKATPVSDMFTKSGRVREDGRMVYDFKLLEAKTLAESKGEWDIYKTVAIVPGDQVFRPLAESPCPLVKK